MLSVYCVARVKSEYEQEGKLSRMTGIMVWILYFLHGGLTFLAAVESVWLIPIPTLFSIPFGVLLLILGTVLLVAGVIAFGSLERMSGMKTNRLIHRGIYRWSRNPQNVGLVLSFLGVAIIGKSGLALFLVFVFCIGFMAYLPIEEKYLLKKFGNNYREYLDSAPRYFGFPK